MTVASATGTMARSARHWIYTLGGLGFIPLGLLDNSVIPLPGSMDVLTIFLSARKEQRDIDMGMKFGANDYLVKPFLPDDLLSRSLKLLKKQSARTISCYS